MNNYLNPLLPRLLLAALLTLTAATPTAYAALDSHPWNIQGVLSVKASLGAKTAQLKKQSLEALHAEFAADHSFSLSGNQFDLIGSWSEQKKRCKLVLDGNSVAKIVSTIKNDLAAQTGLKTTLLLKSYKAGCKLNKSGTVLNGKISVKAKLAYPEYSSKTGSLQLDYLFEGDAE